jgi:hypothetical protein
MEKKGEMLNQLAIISDLLEKINLDTTNRTVVFELKENDFINAFEIIQKKYGKKMDKPNKTFTITIGDVDIVFNMSSV